MARWRRLEPLDQLGIGLLVSTLLVMALMVAVPVVGYPVALVWMFLIIGLCAAL